jgi:hypothetical protein
VTLVDATTGEVVAAMLPDDARTITDQIKVAVEATWQLIAQAYQGRAWAALGYASWDDYCTREFGSARLRLPREERQEVVASLRDSGLSIRAIAAATGDHYSTVSRDLTAGVANATPAPPEPPASGVLGGGGSPIHRASEPGSFGVEKPVPEPKAITGIDGKTYTAPATPAPRRSSLADDARAAGWQFRKAVERMERIAADDRFPTQREQVAAEWTGHLLYAIDVCQDFLDGFTTES